VSRGPGSRVAAGRRPPRPPVAARVADLAEGASSRRVVRPGDARSGAGFELLEIGGERYVLKTLRWSGDWIMRAVGDRDHRTFRLWRSGLMHRLPPSIDHTVVAMALEGSGPDALLGILMRDVGELLVPEGDAVVAQALHRQFVDHLASLCAAFWGWHDQLGLAPMATRLCSFSPGTLEPELARPDVSPVVTAAFQGWDRLARRAPELHAVALRLHARPEPLIAALARTPATFLHGDWKMGNLGAHPDGRTILIDWAYPGEGPACWDLGWYLALNRMRLPESKEDAIAAFRAALRRHGVDVDGWFERQLRLCLLGMMAAFGWEKALGDDGELGWWVERLLDGARLLDALASGWR
jgi:hypothetical protein